MNNGNKIITILGIAAAVIFVATILVSMGVHYATKRHHEARYAEFCTIAEKGRNFDEVNTELKDAGFSLLTQDILTDGGKIQVYIWDEKENAKQFQQKKLGVPVAAKIKFDPAGILISCEGLMTRPLAVGEE